MGGTTNLHLDDQLCFALYAATNTVTRAYRPLLERIALTYPQYLVMLTLWQHGELSVGEIAGRLAAQRSVACDTGLTPEALAELREQLHELVERMTHLTPTEGAAS